MRALKAALWFPFLLLLTACGSPSASPAYASASPPNSSAGPGASTTVPTPAPSSSSVAAVPAAGGDATCLGPALTDYSTGFVVDAVGQGSSAFCIVPRDRDRDPTTKSPCFNVDLKGGSVAPIAAVAGEVPEYVPPVGAPLLSPDGKTRVVLPKQFAGPVKSVDVKTGKVLGTPKLNQTTQDMEVNLALSRFVGDTLFLVFWLEPSGFYEAHLYNPRTWKELGEMEGAGALREVHSDGTTWAFVTTGCAPGEETPPTVKWMDVATGAVKATLQLPWKECAPDPARVFDAGGRIGIVSTDALGEVAIVDIGARTLVQHVSLPRCIAAKK